MFRELLFWKLYYGSESFWKFKYGIGYKKENKFKKTTEDKDKKAEEIFEALKKSRILGKILFTKITNNFWIVFKLKW